MRKTRMTFAALTAERRAVRDAALDRVKALIDEDPAGRYPMVLLAQKALMGQWYFQHAFTARYGVSPGLYITRGRFAVMCRLLQTTGMTVQDIAREAGFAGMGTACTNFKRRVGCSPTRYRVWAAYAEELGSPTRP